VDRLQFERVARILYIQRDRPNRAAERRRKTLWLGSQLQWHLCEVQQSGAIHPASRARHPFLSGHARFAGVRAGWLRKQQLHFQRLFRRDLRRRPRLAAHGSYRAERLLGASLLWRLLPGELPAPDAAHWMAAHGFTWRHHLHAATAAWHGHRLRRRGCSVFQSDPGLESASAGSAAVSRANGFAIITHPTAHFLQQPDPVAGTRRSCILSLRGAQQSRAHCVLVRSRADHGRRNGAARIHKRQPDLRDAGRFGKFQPPVDRYGRTELARPAQSHTVSRDCSSPALATNGRIRATRRTESTGKPRSLAA